MSKTNIAIIGGRSDGQSGVIMDVLKYNSSLNITCIFDKTPDLKGTMIDGVSIVGDFEEEYQNFRNKFDALHIAIGDNSARLQYANLARAIGIPLYTIIHEKSIVSSSAKVGDGSFIGPGAIIQNNSRIGCASIINSGAIVEHDCVLGDAVHLAPKASLAGRVILGNKVFFGIGSCAIPDIVVGENAFIAAGSIVIKDIDADDFVLGVPAKKRHNIYKNNLKD